jgi:hypothetical protein
MGGWKIAKEPNEKKRLSITYHRTKVQKLDNPKNKKAWKNLNNYIKWKP